MATDELAEGRATKVEAFGTSVMMYRIGEAVFAVASRCTHQGAPLDRGASRLPVGPPRDLPGARQRVLARGWLVPSWPGHQARAVVRGQDRPADDRAQAADERG